MHIFVTGASGWIASALVPELLAAGHTVSGLARSDASAAAVEKLGAGVVRGGLTDLDVLRAAADRADGVVHLAFPHEDISDLAGAARTERAGVAAMVEALIGTGKPLISASGTPITPDRPSTEEDGIFDGPVAARGDNERALLAGAERGFRPVAVRLPRSVHGEGDRHGFVPALVRMFREAGTAMYVGDEGIAVRTLAEALGRRLGLPTASVEPDRLGFFGTMQTVDHATTAVRTRESVDWAPTHPGLLEDIEAGHYDG